MKARVEELEEKVDTLIAAIINCPKFADVKEIISDNYQLERLDMDIDAEEEDEEE